MKDKSPNSGYIRISAGVMHTKSKKSTKSGKVYFSFTVLSNLNLFFYISYVRICTAYIYTLYLDTQYMYTQLHYCTVMDT
jgi:hypothetical protein